MADTKESNVERQEYVRDTRIACKYGTKCYQKNHLHLQKYKHPPPPIKKIEKVAHPRKKFKMDINETVDTGETTETTSLADLDNDKKNINQAHDEPALDTNSLLTPNEDEEKSQENNLELLDLGQTPKDFDPKDFIKQKFLVEMPEDFYNFWDFCKRLKEQRPQDALKDVGLTLVGPYDVLAGKFFDVPEQPSEKYLIHWRFFYDPPELQTVLKGNDKTEFHIGYFRDSPKEMPVYLASNFAKTDGTFKHMGDNIFAAVFLYLEDLKKTGDPFKRMHIGKVQSAVKKKAEELNLSLEERSQKVKDRDKKIISRSFSKMGIIVPYNRKTKVGYRDLSISNKELLKLLNNIQNALPEQRKKFLSDLQNVLTNVNIATDECDFGTGIELGLNIVAHGVESLNQTASRVLAINYRLVGKEEFAMIAEAHMKNRKKDANLSII